MMANRWPRVPLGDVIKRRTEWITLDPDTDYRQVTVRLWGEGVALRGTVKGSAIAASQQLRVRTGQFIMSKIDARHGAFGIVPDSLDGAVVSQDFPVFETRPDRLLPDFLGWISKTDWFVELCKAASEGSTNRVRLKEDRFLRHTIPVPTIPEQQRLISELGRITDLLENRKHTAATIEAETNSLLLSAFSRITSGAVRVRLGEIAPLVRREVEIDPEASYPELGVRSFGKGTFHKAELAGIDVGSKRLFRIEPGDLVFNIVFAWEGAVAVAGQDDKGRFGSHRFLTCVPDPRQVTAEFLRFFFLTDEGLDRLGKASPGGAGRNRTLGIQALDAIEIPLPSMDAQHWFDSLQRKAVILRARSAEAATDLDQLIPAMLDREFLQA